MRREDKVRLAKREKEIEETIKSLTPGSGVDWDWVDRYMQDAMKTAKK